MTKRLLRIVVKTLAGLFVKVIGFRARLERVNIMNKTALVTGASKGIGKSIAQALVKSGYQVIGTCREPDDLKENEKIPGVIYKKMDLSDEDSIKTLISELPSIDVLINNAGSSLMAPVEEISQEVIQGMFQINLFGHISMIKGVLPGMRKQKKGLIINITSFASHTPVPFSAVYASAKSAMETLSMALNNETLQFGVRVVAVAPVFVSTNIYQQKICNVDSDYYPSFKTVSDLRDASIDDGVSPHLIADQVMKIIQTDNPKVFYAVGKNAGLLHLASKILPGGFLLKNIRKKFKIS